MPPLKTRPAAPPVTATEHSARAADSVGDDSTTPTDATDATASPQPIARSGTRRGKISWLTAPDTSTRNPAAPTRA
jgi:hypothetical protein